MANNSHALSFALIRQGRRMPVNMRIMDITTRSSRRVKPPGRTPSLRCDLSFCIFLTGTLTVSRELFPSPNQAFPASPNPFDLRPSQKPGYHTTPHKTTRLSKSPRPRRARHPPRPTSSTSHKAAIYSADTKPDSPIMPSPSKTVTNDGPYRTSSAVPTSTFSTLRNDDAQLEKST